MEEHAYGKDTRGDKKRAGAGNEIAAPQKKTENKNWKPPSSDGFRSPRQPIDGISARAQAAGAFLSEEEDVLAAEETRRGIAAAQLHAARQAQIRARALEEKQKKISGEINIKEHAKKMVGPGFWMIVGVAIMKDILDFSVFAISAIIAYLSKTVELLSLGAKVASWASFAVVVALGCATLIACAPAIGIAVTKKVILNKVIHSATTAALKTITVLVVTAFSLAYIFISLIFNFIIFFYLFYVGVRPSTRKLVLWALCLIIELLPGLGILPLTTVSLFLTRRFENAEQKERSQKQVRGTPRLSIKTT